MEAKIAYVALLSPSFLSSRYEVSSPMPNIWQEVNSRISKRSANYLETTRNVRSKLKAPISQATPIQNRFQVLGTGDNSVNNALESNTSPPKPPPVFIPGVVDTKPLIEILDTVAKSNYYLKTINNNQIKIQPSRIIVKTLTQKNVDF